MMGSKSARSLTRDGWLAKACQRHEVLEYCDWRKLVSVSGRNLFCILGAPKSQVLGLLPLNATFGY